MTRTKAWALKTNQGRYINFPVYNLSYFEAYRIMTFKTRKQATEWISNDRFWKGKAIPVKVVITTKMEGQ
jgi:hypothetical protein